MVLLLHPQMKRFQAAFDQGAGRGVHAAPQVDGSLVDLLAEFGRSNHRSEAEVAVPA